MKNINVLHIEDDLGDAFLVKQLLTNQPNSFFSTIKNVDRIADGLKELENGNYQVVLLDLDLLDLKGLDNLRCIKEENPNMPVVILTGSNSDALAKRAIIEGAQEYLFKGQSSGDILQRVIASSILRKEVENELNEQLHFDPLTKLPNRLFFKKVVEKLIRKAERHNMTEAMFFIDLNRFKHINDTYGHEIGNHVLATTAQRMEGALRSSDIIARYAGDEFVIYIDGKEKGLTKEVCAHIAQKLIQSVESPIIYQEHVLRISLSIGISMFPYDGVSYAELIEAADQSMYVAKKQEFGCYSFAELINEKKPNISSALH